MGPVALPGPGPGWDRAGSPGGRKGSLSPPARSAGTAGLCKRWGRRGLPAPPAPAWRPRSAGRCALVPVTWASVPTHSAPSCTRAWPPPGKARLTHPLRPLRPSPTFSATASVAPEQSRATATAAVTASATAATSPDTGPRRSRVDAEAQGEDARGCFCAPRKPCRRARAGGRGSRLPSCDTGPGLPRLPGLQLPVWETGDPCLHRGKLGGRPLPTFTAVSATAGGPPERTGPTCAPSASRDASLPPGGTQTSVALMCEQRRQRREVLLPVGDQGIRTARAPPIRRVLEAPTQSPLLPAPGPHRWVRQPPD